MDIIPVSDPAIFSETQRFAQTQAIMQRAQAMPQMYDARKVEEMFLRNMKVPANEVLQPLPGSEDMDPVSENVAAAMGRPIYVLPSQDHIAHLMTHLPFMKSPLFGSNPAIAKTYLYPISTHLRDHILNYYLVEAHNVVDKAQTEKLIPEEAENQVKLILEVQKFIENQLGSFAQELAQIDEAAQKFAPKPQLPPDNSMQIAQLNAQVQGQAMQQRMQVDQAKLQVDQQKMQSQQQLEAAKLQSQQQLEAAKLQSQQQANFEKTQAEQLKQQAENERTAAELETRERMNTADNDTAKLLAAAEMATGEKVAYSTGTGINPNP
jgi:hypothetical protein